MKFASTLALALAAAVPAVSATKVSTAHSLGVNVACTGIDMSKLDDTQIAHVTKAIKKSALSVAPKGHTHVQSVKHLGSYGFQIDVVESVEPKAKQCYLCPYDDEIWPDDDNWKRRPRPAPVEGQAKTKQCYLCPYDDEIWPDDDNWKRRPRPAPVQSELTEEWKQSPKLQLDAKAAQKAKQCYLCPYDDEICKC